ncbi:TetR/AcrR family transcriptional regulator [Alteribacillus sp. YIM 98480]|uniref:TetR/AcrR family transcriptional regulator n=1 Tax=Alteribacillus sp. YIM 98480 TaxID=2606599 RepID=UPI001E4F7576|nr:TetR/AcrR family transcriptional regulator [Alteribacillus sp. YIM 98480]
MRSAEYVFGKNGYHQSSITEITQNAGVSLGSFYTYFESKFHIFETLLWEMVRGLIEVIKKRTIGIQNRIELEKEGFKAFFDFIKERPYWYSLFPQAEFVDKKLYQEIFEKFAESYVLRIQDSINKGEIRPVDPEILVYSFIGITNYIGMKWIIWDKKDVDDDLIEELMSFIKFGIAPEQNLK